MWIINDTQIINRTREFTDGNGDRQRGIILVQWSKEALAEIGVKPFVEVPYDKEYYSSTGFSDADVDGVTTRTHTTEARYTVEEVKALKSARINSEAHAKLMPTDYYIIRDADSTSSDTVPQAVTDERTQIRTDITTNDAALAALTVYADVIAFAPTWTDQE